MKSAKSVNGANSTGTIYMKVHSDTASCMSDYLAYIVHMSRLIVRLLTVSGARPPQRSCHIGRLSGNLLQPVFTFVDQLVSLPGPNKYIFWPKPDQLISLPKPYQLISLPKPYQLVFLPKPYQLVFLPFLPKPDQLVFLPKPDQVVFLPKPDQVVFLPKPYQLVFLPKPGSLFLT